MSVICAVYKCPQSALDNGVCAFHQHLAMREHKLTTEQLVEMNTEESWRLIKIGVGVVSAALVLGALIGLYQVYVIPPLMDAVRADPGRAALIVSMVAAGMAGRWMWERRKR